MNGNANLNANNLTPSNVKDWQDKLGLTGNVVTGIDSVRQERTYWGNYNGTSRTYTSTHTLQQNEIIICAWAIPYSSGNQYSNNAIWTVTKAEIVGNQVNWGMSRATNDGSSALELFVTIAKLKFL